MKRNILSRKIETDRRVGHCRSKKESEEVGQKWTEVDRSGKTWEETKLPTLVLDFIFQLQYV